jgi:choline dehydrogenase-like flavoprotein
MTWRVRDLVEFGPTEALQADVLVVGGGPAGLTVAQELGKTDLNVVILESGGLKESPETEELNDVETTPGTWSDAQSAKRRDYHGSQTDLWDHDRQNYGVRCRLLGGSTQAWAGKSAAFDAIDYAKRAWVPNSGWPISPEELKEPLERAARTLNLGPNCYDDKLWDLMKRNAPVPMADRERLGSFFWQFSRSRIAPMEVMQTGHEFLNNQPRNCRVLTGATVLEILCTAEGNAVCGVRVADAQGVARIVHAKQVVLAASTIENARLLLNSRGTWASGLGNEHGIVGRYLMDHPSAVLGHFDVDAILPMSKMFGFFGLRTEQGTSMYMRGLAPSLALQQEEELLNCAVFMPGERSADDPLPAIKRILTGKSEHVPKDLASILRSPGIVAKGLARATVQHPRFPTGLTRFAVEKIVRFRPNFAAEEYLTGGMPHKLVGLAVQGICEQAPSAENRVTLSERTDRFGQPLPLVHWSLGPRETRTLAHLGRLVAREFDASGLPVPQLEPWVRDNQETPGAIIDMAHSCGTTRMATDPKKGVVDSDCRVHGLTNLYIAGASVFPTSGHANPTLMIVALAHRLADHLSSVSRKTTATAQS